MNTTNNFHQNTPNVVGYSSPLENDIKTQYSGNNNPMPMDAQRSTWY